jgi:hypothetical protein
MSNPVKELKRGTLGIVVSSWAVAQLYSGVTTLAF